MTRQAQGGLTSLALLLLLSFRSAAGAQPPQENPLVFVPGVLGSRLCQKDDLERLLWGDMRALRSFEDLRLPTDPRDTAVVPCGIVDRVQVFPPFGLDQYNDIVRFLTKELGYEVDRDLLLFDYDWRQSNFDTATELARLADSPPLAGRRFDVLAHSMGGIVARIYVQRLGGDSRVRKLVTMGTPHRGSLKMLRMLLYGFGFPQRVLVGRQELRDVAFSFPSIVELLPFYEKCCSQVDADGERSVFDMLNNDFWWTSWAPERYREAPWRQVLETRLERAGDLRRLLWTQPQVEFHPLAGSRTATLARVRVDAQSGRPLEWLKLDRGDGTVLLASARGSTTVPGISFAGHGHLFNDKHLQEVIGLALERLDLVPDEIAGREGDLQLLLASGASVRLNGVEVGIDPPLVPPCQPIEVSVSVHTDRAILASEVEVVLSLIFEGEVLRTLAMPPVASGALPVSNNVYRAVLGECHPGGYELSVALPGIESPAREYFGVTNAAL